jgi:uncharacterized phage protein (TIGR01671 family)
MVDHRYLEHHRSGFRLFDKEDWGKEFELMQYAGLKDKHGKEIYESDIGVFEETGFNVVYDDRIAAFGLVGADFNPQDATHEFFRIPEDFEVIGNIYETPELLNN